MATRLTVKKRAVLDSNQQDDVWTEWKTKRDEILQDLADGPGQVSVSVGNKSSEKVVLVSSDGSRGTDLWVGLEYSCSVTINCPQTGKGLLEAKALASELAAEENLDWMASMEPEILKHLRKGRFGERQR